MPSRGEDFSAIAETMLHIDDFDAWLVCARDLHAFLKGSKRNSLSTA